MQNKPYKVVKADSGTAMDREHFSRVYDAYMDKIYRFIYYKTYNRETAEDLTSTTFLKALDNIARFNPAKGDAGPWLYKIARNLVIDFYRKKRHTVSIEDVWDLAGAEDITLDTHNKLQMEEVRQFMQKLPMEQRDILILRIWEDLSYKEIARISNKSEAACKMLFSRTITRMRNAMATTALWLLVLFKWTA